ncbi:phage portal protein [Brucella anthropi]|uniref:phage portal protein n=1 Tax=Brucella anthropi TaxID=529 RepID=UPI00124DEFCE|nr:phage portal protein [Brucella anthropi]KAB2780498.1 phage portal protein [Brucella anthropi]
MNIWPSSKTTKLQERVEALEQKSGTSVPEDWLMELFTGSVANAAPVSAATALTVPAVSAAVRVISEACATLQVKIVTIDDKGHAEPDNSHPAYSLLTGQANDWLSGFELIRDLVSQALCNDAGGFAWINRVNGKPFEIIQYDSGNIGVQYDAKGTGEPTYRLNGKKIKSDDVIHLRGPFSRCPLTLAKQAITAAHVMEAHAVKLFQHGARPGGVIETPKPLGHDGAKNMIAMWRQMMDGTDNSGKSGILWDGASWKALTFNSVDSQFLELRRFQIEEIARAFNIPAPMIGDLQRATWSNSEQKSKEFLSYTLEPWLRAIEAALTRALFNRDERKSWKVTFERDDITRVDLAQRATAYSSMIASRLYSPNEIRAWEGDAPYEGGDEYANPNTGNSQPGVVPENDTLNLDDPKNPDEELNEDA